MIPTRTTLLTLTILLAVLYVPAVGGATVPKKQILIPNCTNLSTQNVPSQGLSTNLTFSCGSNPAFTATQPLNAVPTYSLPAGYTAIYITGSSTFVLTSGGTFLLPAGNYVYLLQYNGFTAGTLASFSITWTSK